MGGNVETFLSKFYIVWIDTNFKPKTKNYQTMTSYINELNSYNFTACKPCESADVGVGILGHRTCLPSIVISSGGICMYPDKTDKKTLLDKINENPNASKNVIDHIIYCMDDIKYRPV